MEGLSPYRIAAPPITRFAPSVRWARYVGIAITLGSALVPAFVACDLVNDKSCAQEPTPHWDAAFYVIAFAVLFTWLAILFQRRFARWVHDRVLVASRMASVLYASSTLLPNVLFGFVVYAFAIWMHFTYTFKLCLGGLFRAMAG